MKPINLNGWHLMVVFRQKRHPFASARQEIAVMRQASPYIFVDIWGYLLLLILPRIGVTGAKVIHGVS